MENITYKDYTNIWETEERRSAKTIMGRSPYSRLFVLTVPFTFSKEDEENRNVYLCPEFPIGLKYNCVT